MGRNFQQPALVRPELVRYRHLDFHLGAIDQRRRRHAHNQHRIRRRRRRLANADTRPEDEQRGGQEESKRMQHRVRAPYPATCREGSSTRAYV